MALGSGIENPKIGSWKVYARGNAAARNYSIQVKKIFSEHFNDSTEVIEGWYQPIATVEVAQTIMEKFRFQPGWQPQLDEYAYGEIGKDNSSASTGSKLRPSSGLRPINDNALGGFLAGLDIYGADESAFGYMLAGSNLIDDKMAAQPQLQLRVAVFVGDGDSNGTPNAYNGAVAARDLNIIVYTIGVGRDFNFTDLKKIADITGGTFYNAQDQNSLDAILNLIAQKIGVSAAMLPIQVAPDVNIFIPIAPGSIVHNVTSTPQGTYALTSTQLSFYIKDLNDLLPWYGSYMVNYPCNVNNTCSDTNHAIPEHGSYYNYVDVNGNLYLNLDFNAIANVTLNFRDLNVEFVSAAIIDVNQIQLTVGVRNVGYLDSIVNPTDVNIYLNDPGGSNWTWLGKTQIAGPLCGLLNPSCTAPLKSYDTNSLEVFQEGMLYARIDENVARDCPRGNKQSILCISNPAARFFSVEYQVWKT